MEYKPIVLAGILSPVLADDSNHSLFLSVLLLLQRSLSCSMHLLPKSNGLLFQETKLGPLFHTNAYYSPTDDG